MVFCTANNGKPVWFLVYGHMRIRTQKTVIRVHAHVRGFSPNLVFLPGAPLSGFDDQILMCSSCAPNGARDSQTKRMWRTCNSNLSLTPKGVTLPLESKWLAITYGCSYAILLRNCTLPHSAIFDVLKWPPLCIYSGSWPNNWNKFPIFGTSVYDLWFGQIPRF